MKFLISILKRLQSTSVHHTLIICRFYSITKYTVSSHWKGCIILCLNCMASSWCNAWTYSIFIRSLMQYFHSYKIQCKTWLGSDTKISSKSINVFMKIIHRCIWVSVFTIQLNLSYDHENELEIEEFLHTSLVQENFQFSIWFSYELEENWNWIFTEQSIDCEGWKVTNQKLYMSYQ